MLARLTNAPLALLTALPHESPGYIPAPEYALALQRDAEELLDAAAAPLRAERDVSTLVRMGSPAHALHDAAVQLGAATVVVGSTHRGRVGRVLAGDVAAGLLHGAPAPSSSPRAGSPAITHSRTSRSPTRTRTSAAQRWTPRPSSPAARARRST